MTASLETQSRKMQSAVKKIRIAVIGATGYSGEELLRILIGHPRAEVVYTSGKAERPLKLQEIYPDLQGKVDLDCKAFDAAEAGEKADLIFLALPHQVSMKAAGGFLKAGKRVVDISADYRLRNPGDYPKYYGFEHTDPENLKIAVYGLPEMFRQEIAGAKFVANPGCYPTGVALALLPWVQNAVPVTGVIVIDSKSGVSGAGRNAAAALRFAEEGGNFKAYKVESHSHEGEICQFLSSGKERYAFAFVPHLLPVHRGILTTAYVPLKEKALLPEIRALYAKCYDKEPFVRLLPDGEFPELKSVEKTNQCHIGLAVKPEAGMVVIVSAIDNLRKGASGQAVQNMNLMYGFPETEGLL